VTGDRPVSPERLERARRLVEGAGRPRLPYPSREAVDPIDRELLAFVEGLSNVEFVARYWLTDDPEETR
jgi:hypothetical protein